MNHHFFYKRRKKRAFCGFYKDIHFIFNYLRNDQQLIKNKYFPRILENDSEIILDIGQEINNEVYI